jgi:hypothetical protein
LALGKIKNSVLQNVGTQHLHQDGSPYRSGFSIQQMIIKIDVGAVLLDVRKKIIHNSSKQLFVKLAS